MRGYFCGMSLKQTLIDATQAGAAVMKYYFDKQFTVSNKEGINNLVTEADLKSEEAIFATIKSNYPNHFILSEQVKDFGEHSALILSY